MPTTQVQYGAGVGRAMGQLQNLGMANNQQQAVGNLSGYQLGYTIANATGSTTYSAAGLG